MTSDEKLQNIRAMIEQIKQQLDELIGDDWTEWHGGECPVDPNIFVAVVCRDGEIEEYAAYGFVWGHGNIGTDIVKYKIVR